MNQLSRAILGVWLAEIQVLKYMNVPWNKLRGGVPTEMGGMKNLTADDFSP